MQSLRFLWKHALYYRAPVSQEKWPECISSTAFKTAWHRFSSFYNLITIIYDGHLEDISYLQTILRSKAWKILKVSASHPVLKDNFTVVAQPTLSENLFSLDPCGKGTTESLQAVHAHSIHFPRCNTQVYWSSSILWALLHQEHLIFTPFSPPPLPQS